MLLAAATPSTDVRRDLASISRARSPTSPAPHRDTPMVARTLTQHAVPTTFGLKVAAWLTGGPRRARRPARADLPGPARRRRGHPRRGRRARRRRGRRACVAAATRPGRLPPPGTPRARRHPARRRAGAAAPTPGAGSPTTCSCCRGPRSASSPRAPAAGRRRCRTRPTRCCRCWSAGPPSATPQLAATLHLAAAQPGRRARRRRLARRVGDAARPGAPHRWSPASQTDRAARRSAGGHRTGWPPRCAAAGEAVLAEQRAMAALAGHAARAVRTSATPTAFVDAVLARARQHPERRANDPEHHRRPADRRPAPRRAAAAGPRARRSAPRPPRSGRLRRGPHRRASTSSPGTCPATATTGRCPTSRSRWPSSRPACSRVVDDVLAAARRAGGPFFYAGDSVGGAVGLQLLLDAPAPGRRAPPCSAPAPGSAIRSDCGPAGSSQVSVSGTPVMVTGSAERWFGPGFLDREPERGVGPAARAVGHRRRGLRPGLRRARRLRRARPARRDRAPRCSRSPAAADVATPPDELREIADGRPGRPARRARRRRPPGPGRGAGGRGRPAPRSTSSASRPGDDRPWRGRDAGMAVRREVLGDAHVDRAIAGDHRLHPGLPGAHHRRTPGARSGPGPASTGAAAR